MSIASEIVIFSDDLEKTLIEANKAFEAYYHFQWLERPPVFAKTTVVRSEFGDACPSYDELITCQLLWNLSINHNCWIHYYNFRDSFNPFVLNYIDLQEFEPEDDEDEYTFWVHHGKLFQTSKGLTGAIEDIKNKNVREIDLCDDIEELWKETKHLSRVHDIEVNITLDMINMFYHYPWTINDCLEHSDSGRPYWPIPDKRVYTVKLGINGDSYTKIPTEALSHALVNGFHKRESTYPDIQKDAPQETVLKYDVSRLRFQNELMTSNALDRPVDPIVTEELSEEEFASNLVTAFQQCFDDDELQDEMETFRQQVKDLDLSDDFLEYVWKHELKKPEAELQKHTITKKRPLREYNNDSDYESEDNWGDEEDDNESDDEENEQII